MPLIDPDPLGDEFAHRFWSVVANDSFRHVAQVKTPAADDVFHAGFVDRGSVVDPIENSAKGNRLAQFWAHHGHFVM